MFKTFQPLFHTFFYSFLTLSFLKKQDAARALGVFHTFNSPYYYFHYYYLLFPILFCPFASRVDKKHLRAKGPTTSL